jgi:hypothetical protein
MRSVTGKDPLIFDIDGIAWNHSTEHQWTKFGQVQPIFTRIKSSRFVRAIT